MEQLTKAGSLDDFFINMVIPLSFYGLGSVNEILSMRLWEIHEMVACLKDENLTELYKNLKGLNVPKR